MSSRVWDYFGSKEPYYGVLSSSKFRTERLDSETLRQFFATGVEIVDKCISDAERAFGPLTFDTALDYGCGVGRLTRRLAERFRTVVAVDISDAMLETTRANLAGFNVSLERAHSMGNTSVDFLVSKLVFQHIRPNHGTRILRALSTRLNGVGVIDIPTRDKASVPWRALRRAHRLIGRLMPGEPIIPMYTYNQRHIVDAIDCDSVITHYETAMFEMARVIFRSRTSA